MPRRAAITIAMQEREPKVGQPTIQGRILLLLCSSDGALQKTKHWPGRVREEMGLGWTDMNMQKIEGMDTDVYTQYVSIYTTNTVFLRDDKKKKVVSVLLY